MAGFARLLCVFGHHAAAPSETWNHGYGFTNCQHCGRDLVRSMLDHWKVPPRGFRVAWHPAERATIPAAANLERAAPITARFSAVRDFMEEPTSKPIPRPTSPRAAGFDDFMSDAPPPARSTGTNGRA